MVDRPGSRRRHSGWWHGTGGIAMWFSFLFVLAVYLLLPLISDIETYSWFPKSQDPQEMRRIFGLIGGTLFCSLFGLADDKWDLNARYQYLAQFLAAFIAMSGLIFIKMSTIPFKLDCYGDQMDSLVDCLSGHNLLVHGLYEHSEFPGWAERFGSRRGRHPGSRTGPAHVVGAPRAAGQRSCAANHTSGFSLRVSLLQSGPPPPFHGQQRQLFLGFAVAAIGIMGGAKIATVTMVLGLPIVDVAWLIYSRLRRGLAPWHAGRDHLHFILLDRGISERLIVFAYYLLCCLFGLLTLTLDDRLNKLLALFGFSVLAVAVMAWLGRNYGRKLEDQDVMVEN